MKLDRKEYETRQEKGLDFIAGYGGWYIVNAVVAFVILLVTGGLFGPGVISQIAGFTMLALNVVALMLLALIRPWMALGILAAIGVTFLLVLVIAAFIRATCSGAF